MANLGKTTSSFLTARAKFSSYGMCLSSHADAKSLDGVKTQLHAAPLLQWRANGRNCTRFESLISY